MSQKTSTASLPLEATNETAPHVSVSHLNLGQLKNQLRSLGADFFNLLLPETRAIQYVLQPGESLLGIVYGRYHQENGKVVGRGALIATDSRVLLLDKQPMFIKCDEVIYDAVSGVHYGQVWLIGTIVVHTKLGDITLRTFNQQLAQSFIRAVEDHIYVRQDVGLLAPATIPVDSH